jgi:hypothetical protein|tara:strand:- start:116 stop:319 length:204 start_codon:yes stop_codon:yes gene_type:complete
LDKFFSCFCGLDLGQETEPGNLGRDKPFFYFLFQKIEGGQNPEFSPAKRGEQKLMPPSFLKFGFSTG